MHFPIERHPSTMAASFVHYWWQRFRREYSLVDVVALALLYTAIIGVGVSIVTQVRPPV